MDPYQHHYKKFIIENFLNLPLYTESNLNQLYSFFGKIDKNSDGVLTWDEFRAGFFAQRRLTELFEECDLDHNGKVSETELIKAFRLDEKLKNRMPSVQKFAREELHKKFERADLNSDGELTWDEFLAAFFKVESGRSEEEPEAKRKRID